MTKSPRLSLRFSFGLVKGHTWSYCAEGGRAWERGYSNAAVKPLWSLPSKQFIHYTYTTYPGGKVRANTLNFAVFRVITRQSRVFFSRVFAFSLPNTVRTRVISPIDGRETARKRSDNINTFYVLFAPAREFIRETA